MSPSPVTLNWTVKDNPMTKYEYRSIAVPGKFKKQRDLDQLDKVINESAAKGWELVTYAAVAHSQWNYGLTSAIVATFRRPK